jgi:hypothetical protein
VATLAKIDTPANGRVIVCDAKTPGLAFTVTDKGNRAFYVVRRIHGRPTRLRLGGAEMTIDQARTAAMMMQGSIAGGADPAEERRQHRHAGTLAFGGDIDYAQLVKVYGPDKSGPGRYSPPEVISVTHEEICGSPDIGEVSTSYIERQNLTVRMSNRRFTRLTNAFSKKVENQQHSVSLYYFHYNFCRVHTTIKTTPAVKAGIADKVWTMLDFVKMLEKEKELIGGRLTNYKPAKKKIKR